MGPNADAYMMQSLFLDWYIFGPTFDPLILIFLFIVHNIIIIISYICLGMWLWDYLDTMHIVLLLAFFFGFLGLEIEFVKIFFG